MAIAHRLLSICPHIQKRDGRLIATSAWTWQLLTLGGSYRRVVVDPARKDLTIDRRMFWFFRRRRRIRFDAIEGVTYGYDDIAYTTPLTTSHESSDLFSVGLRLYSAEEVHLFHFHGEGTFSNDGPWPDWAYWEHYLLDFTGTQEPESRAFAELLSKMIGVPVMPPR